MSLLEHSGKSKRSPGGRGKRRLASVPEAQQVPSSPLSPYEPGRLEAALMEARPLLTLVEKPATAEAAPLVLPATPAVTEAPVLTPLATVRDLPGPLPVPSSPLSPFLPPAAA
jgi:hypothetical protein